ncbi:MAG: hypothetical protein KGM97_05050 [Alphaproteobacteria bacterium]|nr:hypothetical protein [Alphaproteobacteria bacterium]MDE2630341.1 hypothetical protein [Alphaproteobacteria bacterium]
MQGNHKRVYPAIAVLGLAGLLIGFSATSSLARGGAGMGADMETAAGMRAGVGISGMAGEDVATHIATHIAAPSSAEMDAVSNAAANASMQSNAASAAAGGNSSTSMSTQGSANTNGPNAADRETGLVHAQDRMNENGLEHSAVTPSTTTDKDADEVLPSTTTPTTTDTDKAADEAATTTSTTTDTETTPDDTMTSATTSTPH